MRLATLFKPMASRSSTPQRSAVPFSSTTGFVHNVRVVFATLHSICADIVVHRENTTSANVRSHFLDEFCAIFRQQAHEVSLLESHS